jgi:prepilin-type N-terminal cleavage/methylation domain-containing protein
MIPATDPDPARGSRRKAAHAGFTLVEVMVATVLLSTIILVILSTLIGAYRVAAKARYNDHARYIVKSFADQFLTQQSTDATGRILPLFIATGSTGYGLTWTNSDGSVSNGGTALPVPSVVPANITVKLGDNTGAAASATVTRSVWYLYTVGGSSTLGTPTSSPQNGAGGYVLRGDFTISYQFPPNSPDSRTLTQTISAVRSIP